MVSSHYSSSRSCLVQLLSSCEFYIQLLTLFACSFGCAIAFCLCTSIVCCCCCCCCLPQILVYLVDHTLPENYFSHTLYALSGDMAVFRHLLRFYLPELALHMESLQKEASGTIRKSYSSENPPDRQSIHAYEPPLADVFSMQWFLTIFASVLPRKACRRVWDAIFLEGSEYVLYTALAILAVMERYTLYHMRRLCVCVYILFYFSSLSLLPLSFFPLSVSIFPLSPPPSPLHLFSLLPPSQGPTAHLHCCRFLHGNVQTVRTAQEDTHNVISRILAGYTPPPPPHPPSLTHPPSHPPSLPSSPPPSSLPWRNVQTFLPHEAASLSTPLLLRVLVMQFHYVCIFHSV